MAEQDLTVSQVLGRTGFTPGVITLVILLITQAVTLAWWGRGVEEATHVTVQRVERLEEWRRGREAAQEARQPTEVASAVRAAQFETETSAALRLIERRLMDIERQLRERTGPP